MSREEKGNEETREMELAHKVRRTKDMGKGKKENCTNDRKI